MRIIAAPSAPAKTTITAAVSISLTDDCVLKPSITTTAESPRLMAITAARTMRLVGGMASASPSR